MQVICKTREEALEVASHHSNQGQSVQWCESAEEITLVIGREPNFFFCRECPPLTVVTRVRLTGASPRYDIYEGICNRCDKIQTLNVCRYEEVQ